MRKKQVETKAQMITTLSEGALKAIRGGGDITSGTEEEARTKYSNITLKRG